MSDLINILDKLTIDEVFKLSIGENGHSEYSWSHNIEARIVQLNFQLVRAKSSLELDKLESQFNGLLTDIFTCNDNNEKTKYIEIICKLIVHTRDIIAGKGECRLTYMMLYCLHEFDARLTPCLLSLIFDYDGHSNETIQYGSWKDLNGFCLYIIEKNSNDINSSLIEYCIKYANNVLRIDAVSERPSLLAKWLPREGSKYGWLFKMLACNYFSDYLLTAKIRDTSVINERAVKKAMMDYRKLCSRLNKQIDTTQVKQCANEWSQIDPNKVTSITMNKQRKAFLNLTKERTVRHKDNDDREQCANNFKNYINNVHNGIIEAKGARIGIIDFVKSAYNMGYDDLDSNEVQLLNAQWVNNSNQNDALSKFIAMVDVSGSMKGDPMDAAIGLGIRVAEKSSLGNRIMTFSNKPTWVNLDKAYGFVEKVHTVRKAEWGMNTNFNAALKLILKAIKAAKMSAEDVEDMVLAIFSDMQIDQADNNFGSMYSGIEKRYAKAGIEICGKPYKPPHILFWNLRQTNGFPNLVQQTNTSMLSGFSPVMLNLFCEEGLKQFNPWSILLTCLSNKRYDIVSQKVLDLY